MALHEITVIDAPLQRLDTYLSDTAVSLELFFNETTARWSLSLDVEGERKVSGLRMVPGADLIGAYRLGVGHLYLIDTTDGRAPLDRDALPSGAYRLIHDDGLATEADDDT